MPTTRYSDAEAAIRRYCEQQVIICGRLYPNQRVRVFAGRHITAVDVTVTFGRKHEFWQVCVWTILTPGWEKRLQRNVIRALGRKLRKLGWLRN